MTKKPSPTLAFFGTGVFETTLATVSDIAGLANANFGWLAAVGFFTAGSFMAIRERRHGIGTCEFCGGRQAVTNLQTGIEVARCFQCGDVDLDRWLHD